ncbi:MAG: hypothetical protein WA172_15125 [Terriglobales bacterium]
MSLIWLAGIIVDKARDWNGGANNRLGIDRARGGAESLLQWFI